MNDSAYCAFLRGVNVNGRRMKMADVCDVFSSAGMTDVTSVLASGNIIFRSDRPQADLRSILESEVTSRYDAAISLFVRNSCEIEAILSAPPFTADEELCIYTFICEPMFEAVLLDEFSRVTPAHDEKACVSNGIFYWQCAKGAALDSGFSNILGRRAMRDKFTSRNLGTLAKVHEKIKMSSDTQTKC